ncbi:MAG: ATP-binding cassette domain-containing protein [Planctomycetes bacterium]|nr:ATP-binding cassette domain-containing protein [Planctomycetota bacterium]
MSAETAIEIASVSHFYGDRRALDEVSMQVPGGRICGLLGPNGGGKTTLFKILTTLITPTSGAAYVGGCHIVERQRDVRRKIGVVFQTSSLDPLLTAMENLTHQGHLYGLRGAALQRRAALLLELFGLGDRSHDRVAIFSGGMQRRLELAKALLHQPEVLILDEPSTGLDPAARRILMDHLHELRDESGITTLITTHLMEEADRCDLVAILDNGRLVGMDSPTELKRTIGGEVLTISTANPRELVQHIKDRFEIAASVVDGQVHIEHERGHALVGDIMDAFPERIESITVGKPTLEDVFFSLTGHQLGEKTTVEVVQAETIR